MKKLLSLVLLSLTFGLGGCQQDDGARSQQAKSTNVLTVLAGSELKDIEPLLSQLSQATGVTLQMRYTGTMEAVERLQSGDQTDVAWLANNHYAMLVPGAKSKIIASERTMLTPVVLGIKASKAKALGWQDNPNVTWKDIAQAASQGKFTFAMTSPASSNTGFSGLLGLAAALSGKGDALEEKDIDVKRLSEFFKAQRLTAGSSGWLADAFMREQDRVDGIINYASTLMTMNRGSGLREKLVLVYPQDGIVTADYPIMLTNPQKRDAYDKVVVYIRGVDFQKKMAETTLRRPVNPDVQVADGPTQPLVELPFPAKLAVVDAILSAFDNHLRLPTDSTFVLDQSGSMQGERIDNLKTAMLGLAGSDPSISGRFARFRNRERIFLLPFSDTFNSTERFDMGDDNNANQNALTNMSTRVQGLRADGGTAIFSAAKQAYTEAAERRRKEPSRFYSIVVMTDGANNRGLSSGDFIQWYNQLPPTEKGVKIFPVLFGEASPSELQQLAEISGGRMFDSRKTGLQAIFKEIRGYQ